MSRNSRVSSRSQRSVGTFRAFANHSFRFLWPANFLVYTSRWMQMTLLAWFVLELTDSPWYVSLIGFFTWIPMLVLGLVGGLLADSVNRRVLLVITQSLSLGFSLLFTVLLFTDNMQLWHAYIAVLVAGVGWALDMPARSSIIHDLLGADGVTNGMSLDSVGMNGSSMVGPALAGLLIMAADVKGGYIALSVFQLMSLAFLWRARVPTRHKNAFAPNRIIRNLSEGLAYARRINFILAVVVVTVFMNLLVFPFMQMIPVIARDVLHVGPGLMGLLQSSMGMGALVGSVSIASVAGLQRHGRVFLGGSGIGLLALLVFSFSHWYALSFSALFVLGLGVAGFGIMQMTIVMLVAREGMRGRSLGVISLAIGASPLGSLLIGGLASAIGTAQAITVNALVALVFLGLVALVMPSFWRDTTANARDRDEEHQVLLRPRAEDA